MNFIFKLRLQLNDLFSQFNRFISPMYYHDRCERTLQMYVYVMHKREVLLSLLTLLSSYILLLFIGLAGPNVDKINEINARQILFDSNINDANQTTRLLTNGPFIIYTPSLSKYSQQLSLYLIFLLENEETSETFHKDFDVQIDLDGLNYNSNSNNDDLAPNKTLLSNGQLKASLFCSGRKCQSIRIIRLIDIQYQHYRVNVTFDRLESVNQKYTIENIIFEFRSINISFTTLLIWFRFFFLMITIIVLCYYLNYLYRFHLNDWSLEQKWTLIQLLLLILSNNPIYPIQFLFIGSKFPYLLEIWLHTTLQTLIMLFWLCFFHGIRQNNRSLMKFYLIKLVIIGTIWFTVIYTMSWSLSNQLSNPIFDELTIYNGSIFLQLLTIFFYTAFIFYFLYLIILVLSAFTELRLMPYFDLRLKLQTFLMLFVITISLLTILISSATNNNNDNSDSISDSKTSPSSINSNNFLNQPSPSSSIITNNVNNMISLIPFLQLLPFTHFSSSSATFLSIFSLVNIYICSCAYYYRPSLNQSNECHIIRDNPALSMINDSDEEILYGSDTEELINIQQQQQQQQQLIGDNSNVVANLIDTRTDEESD